MLLAGGRARVTVAIYGGNGSGSAMFRVVHDRKAHRPWGLFRIYAHGEELGRLLSFPSHADCASMLEARECERRELAFAADRGGYSARQAARRRAARRAFLRQHNSSVEVQGT